MPRSNKIEDYRNFGIMAHIDAARPRPPSGFSTTPARAIRSRSPRRRRDHGLDGAGAGAGITITSAATTAFWNGKRLNIIDTPGTWISPSKWSVRCGCWTAPWRCSTATRALSPRPKPSGVRPIATMFRASCSSTRWTRPARLPDVPAHHPRAPGRQGRAHPAADRLGTGPEGIVDLVRMKAWCGSPKGSAPTTTTKRFRPT